MCNKKHPFVHLHAHTHRSKLDGCGTEAQWASRAVELGHWAHAITDHGNVIAHVPFAQEAEKVNLRPIFGLEAYVCDRLDERTGDNATLGATMFPHVTLLAVTQTGYSNLLRLTKTSWLDGFYRYPRIDWNTLARHQEGLAVLSGCPAGYPTQLLKNKGIEECLEWMREWSRRIERFYVELDPSPGFDVSEQTFWPLMQVARELGLPTVLTADAHFPRPADHRLQDMMLAIGTGQQVDSPNRQFKMGGQYYACDIKEMYERGVHCLKAGCPEPPVWADQMLREALRETGHVAELCWVHLPKATPVVFANRKKEVAAVELLRNWAYNGLTDRRLEGLLTVQKQEEYRLRCEMELIALDEQGFCDYMLIVIDLIKEMKERGALVLTRGSAGGCMLLWATGASEIDPLLFGLSFDRFFNRYRKGEPPDIDVDFPKKYRQQAIDYLCDLYGRENTAQIGAFTTFQVKQAITDVAHTLGIPLDVIAPLKAALSGANDDVTGQLTALEDPRARAVLARYPELRIADKFVGMMRNVSIHAAGVLVSSEPLEDRVGLMKGADGQVVAQIDKRGAKAQGYLKMDLLTVVGLDILQRAVELIGIGQRELNQIPLNDPETLALAERGELAGIFQLDGAAALRVGREIRIDTFADFAVASALCRPGPAAMAPMYGQHKRDRLLLHSYLAGMDMRAALIVEPTYGVLIYQEQVMRLANELAGLSMSEVQKLRKGISDKEGTNPDQERADAWNAEWRGKFVAGCLAQGVDITEANRWWAEIVTHGGYSFNKSHADQYAQLGYWMLWAKAHHPQAFYQAYLEIEKDVPTRKKLIREWRARGGKVYPLHPQLSSETTGSPEANVLVGGFSDLHGVGPKLAPVLAAQMPFENWEALAAALPRATATLLRRSGLMGGALDPQALVALAPWFPVLKLDDEAAALRNRRGWTKVGDLPDGEQMEKTVGDTVLFGYVTNRDVSPKHVEITLEDETGAVACRVSQKQLSKLGPIFRELAVGDLAVISGWWAGDTFYCKGRVVVRPRPVILTLAQEKKAAKARKAVLVD